MAATRRWAVPRGLLGMLALIAGGEWLIRGFEPSLIAIENWDWRQTGRAATAPEAQGAAVLAFGDSLIKLGVQPKVVAERLGGGRRVFNLALCAGRAPASFFLLRRTLAAGARPEALVVDFHDSFLLDPPAATLRLYAEFLRPGELVHLARTMRDPDFASRVCLAQFLPSVRNRFEIRQALGGVVAGTARFAERRQATSALRHNWRRNLGAQVMPKAPTPVPDSPASWSWVAAFDWRPEATNAAYLASFFELAQARDIPVFWVLPPLHPGLMRRRAEVGYEAPIDRFVAATLARFPGITVVDGRGAGFDPTEYIDIAHLDRDGSRRLSRALGAVLADRVGRPDAGTRIVALPAVPEPASAMATEASPVAR